MNKQLTYLVLDIATLLFPLILSFDKRVNFKSKWSYLFPSITITALFFIVWDVWKTKEGIWSFNEAYVLKYRIFNLPIEEIFFFFCIPYACLFVYACMRVYFKQLELSVFATRLVTVLLIGLFLILAFSNWGKAYPFVTFGFTATFLIMCLMFSQLHILARFYMPFIVITIPFLIIDGFLTGLPIIIYDPAEHLNMRMGSIPIEDMVYNLLMIGMSVIMYEHLQKKYRRLGKS